MNSSQPFVKSGLRATGLNADSGDGDKLRVYLCFLWFWRMVRSLSFQVLEGSAALTSVPE